MKYFILVFVLFGSLSTNAADEIDSSLIAPLISNPNHKAWINALSDQCKGKDGCEALIGDMNTLASLGKTPNFDHCPGEGCRVCNESDPCKKLALEMKQTIVSAKTAEGRIKPSSSTPEVTPSKPQSTSVISGK